MSRFVARFCLVLTVLGLALAAAASPAPAQQQLDYPGPFGSGGDFLENPTSAEPGADADGDGIADTSVPDGSSIDANPAGAGISFVPASAQPSSDPADAVGGTGGGDTGAGLAVTGVETELTMALAMGLLAVGGTSLVTSRRRLASR